MRLVDQSALLGSFRWIARHLPVVIPLCLAIALGRFAQSAHPALENSAAHIALEILVAGGRVTLAVLVFGNGSLHAGICAIRRFFQLPAAERDARFAGVKDQLRSCWGPLAIDFAAYVALALALNWSIAAASQTHWAAGFLELSGADAGSTHAPVLVLKNLSVIPLTVVFQIHFASRLWLRPDERAVWLAVPGA